MAKHLWIVAQEGIRYYEHETRKHENFLDRFYGIHFLDGENSIHKSLGWASEGWTLDKVEAELERVRGKRVIRKFKDSLVQANSYNAERTYAKAQDGFSDDDFYDAMKELSTASYDFFEDDWHIDILIIGVGSDGCAAIETEPTKELLSKKKHAHIHYVGIATEAHVLEKCTVEQKIFIPKSALSVPNEISTFIKCLPTPDMAFVITGAKHEDDTVLSSALVQQLRNTVHSVVGMAILPADNEQDYNESFKCIISHANTTHMLHQENVYMPMVKIFQCIIDTICVKGLICIGFEEVGTVFGSKGFMGEYERLGLLAYMGYGVAHGDEKSQRAEQAAKQALQNITLPAGRTLKDTCAALYSIKASSEIIGEEIFIIGEIIHDALSEDANIFLSVLVVEEVDCLEVQLITVFDEKI